MSYMQHSTAKSTFVIRRVGTSSHDFEGHARAMRAWVCDDKYRVRQWSTRSAAEHHAESLARFNPQWQYVVVKWSV